MVTLGHCGESAEDWSSSVKCCQVWGTEFKRQVGRSEQHQYTEVTVCRGPRTWDGQTETQRQIFLIFHMGECNESTCFRPVPQACWNLWLAEDQWSFLANCVPIKESRLDVERKKDSEHQTEQRVLLWTQEKREPFLTGTNQLVSSTKTIPKCPSHCLTNISHDLGLWRSNSRDFE